MATNDFAALTDDALGERFRDLMRAYDDACKSYEHARAADIHREFYAIEDEMRKRRSSDWRRTGLEELSLEEIVEQFRVRAVAYEDADGSDETEHLYWDIEDVKEELKRRQGDQRRVLFGLYSDPDIRVRALAASATRTLAPMLSEHRQQNIDDDAWAPPASGLDIAQAGLVGVFPTRAQNSGKTTGLGVEQLVEQFVKLSLKQYEALEGSEIARYNRLFGQVWGIVDRLKARDGDQRRALTGLLSHPNPQVRLTAARATLAIAPSAARQVIQTIAESKVQPWALDAGMCLRFLDQGVFKPT